MSIQFYPDQLPILYWFKKETIALCVKFVTDVIRSSHLRKVRGFQHRIDEIQVDLYDLFCRWNFISHLKGELDLSSYLPTNTSFIIMNDLSYYLRRFGLTMGDSFVEFPYDKFSEIMEKARSKLVREDPPRPIYLSEAQQKRLQSVYVGNPDEYNINTKRLASRYQYMGGLNNSLSIPPSILDIFPSHELFGTPLNTHTTFCSPFNDEKVFSSCGSFFEFSDYKEDVVYFANPPFDDVFCSHMATRLLEQLAIRPFHLIVIIPVWDTDEQKKHKLKDFGLPFDGYRRLVNSPYFLEDNYLEKESYPFYNYFTQRNVFISNVHLINLGLKVDTKQLIEQWKTPNEKMNLNNH